MNITGEWFRAAEQVGETIDIRFGRLSGNADEPEWLEISHCEYDGIGAFAELLRDQGAELKRLPENKYPNRQIVKPFLNLLSSYKPKTEIALRQDWNFTSGYEKSANTPSPTTWHIFDEIETNQIREYCRAQNVTVNSYLLHCLDGVVRADTKRPHLANTWFIPVNLRGDVSYDKDTDNHVSGIEPVISDGETVQDIQQQIIHRLDQGEHRRNHLILNLTKCFPFWLKRRYILKSRIKPGGSVGSFSNLGVWDHSKEINTTNQWLFCPPVCTGQMLAAGCVTFQGRLSLSIQCHQNIVNGDKLVGKWMGKLSKRILEMNH